MRSPLSEMCLRSQASAERRSREIVASETLRAAAISSSVRPAHSAFVRTDTLRDTPVVVLRYGTSSVYWLAADDGRMLRFESNNTVGDRPVVVDVLGFREITVDGPPVDQVVDVADIADAYDAALATP